MKDLEWQVENLNKNKIRESSICYCRIGFSAEAVQELVDYATWLRNELKKCRKAMVEGDLAEYDSDGNWKMKESSNEGSNES